MKTNTPPSHPVHVLNPEALRYERHRHYAGEIYLSDFSTGGPDGNQAKRILQAEIFDNTCRTLDLLRTRREEPI